MALPGGLEGKVSRGPNGPGEPPGGICGPAGLARLLFKFLLLLGEKDWCKLGQCVPIAESKQTEKGGRRAFQALHLNVAAWSWRAEIWSQLHEPQFPPSGNVYVRRCRENEMRHPGEKGTSCKGKEILLTTSVYGEDLSQGAKCNSRFSGLHRICRIWCWGQRQVRRVWRWPWRVCTAFPAGAARPAGLQ